MRRIITPGAFLANRMMAHINNMSSGRIVICPACRVVNNATNRHCARCSYNGMPFAQPTPSKHLNKKEKKVEVRKPSNEKKVEEPRKTQEPEIPPPPPHTTEEYLLPIEDITVTEVEESEDKDKKKEKEEKKKKMKRWPDESSELLPYKDIANPLKEIIRQGYRLWRRDDIKGFEYEGYNIGKCELQTQPPPCVRLSEQYLTHEKKLGHTLMDVVLNVMFLLGVEQGRRAEKRDAHPIEALLTTLEIYREKNKDQRIRIDELETVLELKEKFPNISEEDFKKKMKDGLEERRAKRIEELKNELQLDASRSSFQFKTPERSRFKELEALARTFTKQTCNLEQWKHILKEHGWTYKEWSDRCKKKHITIDFA